MLLKMLFKFDVFIECQARNYDNEISTTYK